jgi:RNA polymerase sigma-70 factor (ECF subfamily)
MVAIAFAQGRQGVFASRVSNPALNYESFPLTLRPFYEAGDMAQSVAWTPERYREVLRLMARRLALDPRLQRRFDSSDLVQETLLKAHQNQEQFRGQTEGEWLKWLHEILVNTARDKIREAKADKRNVELEESLDVLVADSSARLARWAAQSSPSEQAERQELLLKIGEALGQLPADQRDVIILHHLMGAPVSEIARELACTNKAVAGLLYRGLKKLRQILEVSQDGKQRP